MVTAVLAVVNTCRTISLVLPAALRRGLKELRATQPFNWLVTRLVRTLARAFGATPGWAVMHLHPMGQVSARLPNGRTLRLWSRGDDWVSNQLFWHGWKAHERETATVFYRLAERSACTLDVGAYVGYFALLAAHANCAARVLAIEPLPAIHARLRQNVELNGLEGRIECVAAAAGASEGTALFYHQPHGLPTSSSLSFEFMRTADDVVSSTARILTIDRLLRERGVSRVDLVKIDTESTEPDVLAGMLEALRRDRPWIVCEVLAGRGAESRLNALLRPLGYRYYLLTPGGALPRSVIEGHPQWLNYLFAGRPEG
jgi:FkbM family methyltransferase